MKIQALKTMFSSIKTEYGTPKEVIKYLEKRFGRFDLDPCALPHNAKAPYYYTPENNGLQRSWFGRVFMNPSYGREIGKWIRKAYEETKVYKRADLVVCLIPSRTDTQWWHKWVMRADEIYFIQGRLTFEGAKNPAPFPSAVVIFKKEVQ